MTRNLKTFTFAMLAFAFDLTLAHKLYVGIVAGLVVGVLTYLTWWPETRRANSYAVGGGMFCLIGIAAITRGDWLPAIIMFVVTIGCAARANVERKRERA